MCFRELVTERLYALNRLLAKVEVFVFQHSLFCHPPTPFVL